MNVASSAPCELLSWDTEFFGRRIGRVQRDQLDAKQASEIDEWCRRNAIEGLYFLAGAEDPATIQAAESHAFRLVDVRVTFERELTSPTEAPSPAPVSGGLIRAFVPEDLPALQAMARTAHTDSRFFSDPQFPRQKAEDLYETWITMECQGGAQQVLVAAPQANQPFGYISCHLDSPGEAGRIGLAAVSEGFRGKGVGNSLVQAALDWFTAQALRQVTVVTQGKNLAAQRLYQRSGFLAADMQLWYHKWYSTSRGKNA
jgi:dTDP-4-amino-4,6-dideoxy-D-galactose acyltransferase